jgi:hypothetical protein
VASKDLLLYFGGKRNNVWIGRPWIPYLVPSAPQLRGRGSIYNLFCQINSLPAQFLFICHPIMAVSDPVSANTHHGSGFGSLLSVASSCLLYDPWNPQVSPITPSPSVGILNTHNLRRVWLMSGITYNRKNPILRPNHLLEGESNK